MNSCPEHKTFYAAWLKGEASIADADAWSGNLGLDEKELSDYLHGHRCLQTILYEKCGFWEKNSGRF
jgi:hypothetical protein